MITCFANHSSRQLINNKSNRVRCKIWVLAEAYGYVVQFKPYQGVKKGKRLPPLLNGDKKITVVGLNDKRMMHIASSKFSEPKRFVRRLKKVEGKYVPEQQPN